MECKISVGLLLLVAVHHATGVSICPTRQITLTQGEVTSPNYPSTYPSNADCSLTIDGGKGARFTVKFHSFELEPDEDDPNACKYDVFTIIDGSRTLSYCGSGTAADFTSTGNKIILGFKSDSNYELNGFKVILSTKIVNTESPTGVSVCPTRTIKINSQEKMNGAIYSPNFPDNYPNNQKCTVTLDVPDNYMTVISFQSFALQFSSSCVFDQLVLSDHGETTTHCGGGANALPASVELKGKNVKIAFNSDETNTASGFQLRYNVTRLQEGRCICTNGLSYFTISSYKPKNNRQADDIRFEFKSTQSSGMIMYAKGFYRDYIYVGYKDSSILLYHIDLGTGEGKIKTTNLKLNDNRWHKVHVTRRNRAFTISIDNGRASAVGQTPGGFNRLDIPTSTGYFLGAPSSLNLLPNFFGCIRNFSVDGVEPVTNSMANKPDYSSFQRSLVRMCSSADQL